MGLVLENDVWNLTDNISVTLLADLDFTTMTSASWTGESTVDLGDQTWTIGNGSNCNSFGPNGSTLILNPKGTSVCDWWGTTRTGPNLSIKLSALDDDLDSSAQYVVQTVCNEHPAGIASYARLMAGFWSDTAASRGYTCLFGHGYDGAAKSYFYMGNGDQCWCSTDGDELTFYTYLNPTGFNEARTSTSADGNTPTGGTFRGAIYASTQDPQKIGEQRTLTMTASAPVNVGLVGVGWHGQSGGATYKIDRLRVWKLKPKA
jgi:hypothetical protein